MRHIFNITLGLVVGGCGGLLFYKLNVPLPFILGGIVFCMIGSQLRLPLRTSRHLTNPGRALLGMVIGGSMRTENLSDIWTMLFSIVLILPYIMCTIVIGMLVFHKLGKMTKEESYFSSLPGGLFTTLSIAESLSVETKRIAAIHALRIFATVMIVPWLVIHLGQHEIPQRTLTLKGFEGLDIYQVFLMCIILLSWPIGVKFRVPGGTILLPMLTAGALSFAGMLEVTFPSLLVIGVQIVLGSGVGINLRELRLRETLTCLLLTTLFTILVLLVTVSIAFIVRSTLDLELSASILAFAPGGLSEMGLVALAIGVDLTYVMSIQVFRIGMIDFSSSLVFYKIRKYLT